MSNRRDLPDDDFNFDDDDFSFDDGGAKKSGSSGGSDFNFDDEPQDIRLDDDDGGFGFEGEDMPDLDEEPAQEKQGGNRTFVWLAALLILLFLVGLGLVLFLALRDTGPTDLQRTATAIVMANMTVESQATETAVANIAFGGTQTAIALVPTNTPTPEPSFTPTLEPTFTPTPTLDETQAAAFSQLTQVAADATNTAVAIQTLEAERNQISPDDVGLTATALAILLGNGNGGGLDGEGEVIGGDATPTPEGGLGSGGPLPTALPNTGLFDDLAAGGNSGILLILVGGLAALMVFARMARAANNRS
jgi:hypothetical protein